MLPLKSEAWSSPKDTLGNKKAAKIFKRLADGRKPLYVKDGDSKPALAYFKSILGVGAGVIRGWAWWG
jgi:hypothetical protein